MRGLLTPTLLLALVLNLVIATEARANKWLAWLEELSGPGPYKGPTVAIEMGCLSKLAANRKLRACNGDRLDSRLTLDAEVSFMDDRPKAYSGDTSLVAARAVVYVPLGQWSSSERPRAILQQISVGGGLGVYAIAGDTTVESPVLLPVLPLRVKVLPVEMLVRWLKADAKISQAPGDLSFLRRLGRSVEYRIGFDYTLKAPNPADFRTAVPEGKRELLSTYSLQINLGPLLGY